MFSLGSLFRKVDGASSDLKMGGQSIISSLMGESALE